MVRATTNDDDSTQPLSRRRLLAASGTAALAGLAGCASILGDGGDCNDDALVADAGDAMASEFADVTLRNRANDGAVELTVEVRTADGSRVLDAAATVDGCSAREYDEVWASTGEYTVTSTDGDGAETTSTVSVDSLDDSVWVTAADDGSVEVDVLHA
ncbi:hypothetical protein [Haloarchaeobius sp. FL176]|uniref:hypothetical protein n=1 Tax=Haloarchaeobius sp. FL176 TaxID=2967129 RepID=UPI0021488D22|nr:hypothetical protein [Haloarchaeobius sp. FL176]